MDTSSQVLEDSWPTRPVAPDTASFIFCKLDLQSNTFPLSAMLYNIEFAIVSEIVSTKIVLRFSYFLTTLVRPVH